jgi:hypothetical protein
MGESIDRNRRCFLRKAAMPMAAAPFCMFGRRPTVASHVRWQRSTAPNQYEGVVDTIV